MWDKRISRPSSTSSSPSATRSVASSCPFCRATLTLPERSDQRHEPARKAECLCSCCQLSHAVCRPRAEPGHRSTGRPVRRLADRDRDRLDQTPSREHAGRPRDHDTRARHGCGRGLRHSFDPGGMVRALPYGRTPRALTLRSARLSDTRIDAAGAELDVRRSALRGDEAAVTRQSRARDVEGQPAAAGVIQDRPAWHLGCGHAMGQQNQIPGQLSCGRPLPVGSSRNSTRKPLRYWSFSARKRLV